jgi:hypothetical protein
MAEHAQIPPIPCCISGYNREHRHSLIGYMIENAPFISLPGCKPCDAAPCLVSFQSIPRNKHQNNTINKALKHHAQLVERSARLAGVNSQSVATNVSCPTAKVAGMT